MDQLSLKIVSPEKNVFEDSGFYSITIPTENGELTILPNHIPIIGKIIPGEIIARKVKDEISLITLNGFLKVSDTGEILVLCDYAIRSEDVEIARVEEARKKAEVTMKEKLNEKEFVIAEAELKRTLLELKVAQKRKVRIRQ